MKLYIVRHGETSANKKELIMGHGDIPLNRDGVAQAKKLAERLRIVNFDFIYSSDLKRARRTTKEIFKYQDCRISYVKALREKNFGDFEGKSRQPYYEYFNEHGYEPDTPIPGGGESRRVFQKRVISFLDRIYKKQRNKTVLFSTHGGVMKMLLLHIYKTPLETNSKLKLDNAALTLIKFHKSGRHKILIENDVRHLEYKNL